MNRLYALVIFAGVFAAVAGLFTAPWALWAGLAVAMAGLYAHAAHRQRQQTGRLTPRQRRASDQLWAEFDQGAHVDGLNLDRWDG
jgi:hypothetical protein